MATQAGHTVAMLSSFVPRRCGIATFTHNLSDAITGNGSGTGGESGTRVVVAAMSDREGEYHYPAEVFTEIYQPRREDYRNAAELLSTSRVDLLCLQHEYGLFGGEQGEYLFELLDRVRKPVVTTLHTILSQPSAKQLEVLRRVCDRSSAVVVMAERARALLAEVYGVQAERVTLIHHGTPDVPFNDTEPFKERFDLTGRPTILTFGLLSPGKGIEFMLDALARVVPEHPDLAYVVLGVTHPGVRRESGELYRFSLERKVVELGIQKNVLFHKRYVSNEDLCEYLQAADLYVTPYPGKEQITSGTLAYALSSGRAIISTPYTYAEELLADGRGRLVEYGNVDALSAALTDLLDDPRRRDSVRRAAYDFGRQMVWPHVARRYLETFREAQAQHAATARLPAAERRSVMRMSLPEVRLDHFFVMSDDTGMLQHAKYATPDRRHGYSADDNARAVVVAAMMWALFRDERVLPRLQVYLSFLHDAETEDGGRFRNFMSYDRRWLEEDGSDDCQGRVVWGLGYLLSHAPNESMKRLATELFRRAVTRLDTLDWPRSWALSMLGLFYYLRSYSEDDAVRRRLAELADKLDGMIETHGAGDWPWFEDEVTYDNARIPQALLLAGLALKRRDLIQRGLRVLDWLMKVQTGEAGHLSIIGNDGWLRRGQPRPIHDQQPLEAAALIGACKAAHRASGEKVWLVQMRRCFEWYVGRNDAGVSMIDFKTRGCYDGLMPDGVNPNQGAESLLSWLLSLLTMHEMQTGDAPEGA